VLRCSYTDESNGEAGPIHVTVIDAATPELDPINPLPLIHYRFE
jgi:hypothetical protein